MDAQLALGLAGSGYGALLAVAAARTQRVAERMLAALIAIGSLCAAAIALEWAWLEPVEVGLSFLSGPVLLAYVTASRVNRWHVAAAVILGAASAFVPFDMMRVAMLHQIAFTAAAAFRGRREWLPMAVTAMMAAIHVGQVVRVLSGERVMPLVIGAGFAFLGAAAWHRVNAPAAPRYARSPLGDAAAAVARLQKAMQEQHPYRNPELTLAMLAQSAGLTPHQLSQVLNDRLATSFADFVNRARIDHVCELLARPESSRLTLEALGQEAGFRSRSAFYAAFRKCRGMTPTEYRASLS